MFSFEAMLLPSFQPIPKVAKELMRFSERTDSKSNIFILFVVLNVLSSVCLKVPNYFGSFCYWARSQFRLFLAGYFSILLFQL